MTGRLRSPAAKELVNAAKERPSRIHYGTSSGTYTESIVVGNVTKATVPGLEDGTTYFLAVSVIGPDGQESEISNEVSYLPGLHQTKLRITASGDIGLAVKGLIGRRYDIEASEDLVNWAIISTVTLGDSGAASFSDPDAARFPKRFYRTRESQ